VIAEPTQDFLDEPVERGGTALVPVKVRAVQLALTALEVLENTVLRIQ
jgi:hypothetical protein